MKKILFIFLLSFSSPLLAQEILSAGTVALSLAEPVVILSNFISTASIIVGVCCLFAALLRYPEHRMNPAIVPLSNIILLIAMGTALLLLPMISKYTEHGVSIHDYKSHASPGN